MSPVVCQIVRKQALCSVHTSLSLSFSSFHDNILPVTPNKYVFYTVIRIPLSTSFPGYSPTHPFGTGRRENLGTRLHHCKHITEIKTI